jgi:alanine transaminase
MPLQISDINPALLKVEYAVRGELAIKAESYREQLDNPNHGLPFDRIISANIGNPQAKGLDQKPITFARQVCWGLFFCSLLKVIRHNERSRP